MHSKSIFGETTNYSKVILIRIIGGIMLLVEAYSDDVPLNKIYL